FFRDAVLVVNEAAGIGHRHHLGAHAVQFLGGVLRSVAGSGNGANLAFEAFTAGLEHFLSEIDGAVAGGLRTNERPAPVGRFARQNTGEFIGQAFVLAKLVTNFTSSNTDVTGWNVGVRPNMT